MVKVDDTTTNADGRFEFEDALELETGDDKVIAGGVELACEPAPGGGCWEEDDEYEYRLSIYVTANGSTVSYSRVLQVLR